MRIYKTKEESLSEAVPHRFIIINESLSTHCCFQYTIVDKLPPFIEDGDYFSLEEQEPVDLIYGDRLRAYITSYNS